MNINKTILGACVFAVGIASAASSYHVKIADSTWVGTTELKPGEYEVRLDGDKITFKQGKKTFEVSVKVETNATKYSDTQMDIKTVNGQAKLQELDLGGTKSKITLVDSPVVEAGTH